MEVIFARDNIRVKKPQHLQKNIFIICLPRTVTVETADCVKIDTNIALNLPKQAKGFLKSRFRGHEIHEINNEKRRRWIEVLNTSYTEDLKIKKNSILCFLVIQLEHLKVKHETKNKTRKEKRLSKNWDQTWKTYREKKKSSNRRLPQQV